jgi:hypothetical protein
MPYGTVNADVIQSSVSGVSLGAGNASIMKNRIINGAMVIDQRNAGASVVVDTGAPYTLDRWIVEDGSSAVLSAQQVTDAPAGFNYSLKVTSTTATGSVGATQYDVITQKIEGYNIADLGFGSASAKTITISFWVKATVAGQYSLTLNNSGSSRLNPQPYTISSANTWEQKSVTFTGDTTGTWLTTNGVGLVINFFTVLGSTYLGSAGWNGSSIYGVTGQANAFATIGNTFQITGVQLEVGTAATGYEYRQYGQELALCQRYYQMKEFGFVGAGGNTTTVYMIANLATAMRTNPSYSVSAAMGVTDVYAANATQSSANITVWNTAASTTTVDAASITMGNFTGLTAGRTYYLNNTANQKVLMSAEL